ncbi:MAG: hypothetical protein Q9187_008115 [Circinaria calcarea]
MSFRKRNIGLSSPRTPQPPLVVGSEQAADSPSVKPQDAVIHHVQIPGVRPSALDGRPTTSTGTPSLDGLLAGHAGLALGNSILLEESGTTDYAGTLLRYYAAEGVVQGHQVHVVGVGEQWGRDLPGLVGTAEGEERNKVGGVEDREKMKIAWSSSKTESGAEYFHLRRPRAAYTEAFLPLFRLDQAPHPPQPSYYELYPHPSS